jgi:hypothetical protein
MHSMNNMIISCIGAFLSNEFIIVVEIEFNLLVYRFNIHLILLKLVAKGQ